MFKKFFALAVSVSALLFAREETPDRAQEGFVNTERGIEPWFTGTLIAPVGTVVPRGDFEIRSFVFMRVDTGVYDNGWGIHSRHNFYSFNPQVVALFGLTEWMDLQISPQFLWNTTHGHSAVHIGDLPIALDFQLYPADKSWFPGVKLTLQESFPIGKYKNLGSTLSGVDGSGNGSYETTFNVLFYKVYHIRDLTFLSTTVSMGYTLASNVHLSGFNAYGGGFGTHGNLSPGNFFTGLFSFEYSLDRNWVFAMDTVYIHTGATHFSGSKGTTSAGKSATVGGLSSDSINFSPSVEYNFSKDFGICMGCYFSGFGRNTQVFRSGVVNLVYTY